MRWLSLAAGLLQVAAGFAVEFLGWRHRYVHGDFGPATGPDGSGAIVLVSDWLAFLVATPLGWLSLWLIGEGVLRLLAAAMDVPMGTLPVAVARFAVRHLRRASTPPAPPDQVERDGDALIVRSAVDYRWDALSTVDVDGTLYVVRGEHSASVTHPHRWRLVPLPADHTIRTVTRYDRREATSARSTRSSASKP